MKMQIIYNLLTFSNNGTLDNPKKYSISCRVYNLRIEDDIIYDGDIIIATYNKTNANYGWLCNYNGCDRFINSPSEQFLATKIDFKIEIMRGYKNGNS